MIHYETVTDRPSLRGGLVGTTFSGPDPWTAVTQAARAKGPRYAAIAFLGVDAPLLLPLKRKDVLVVNAGNAALRAHATSPDAMEHYRGLGVYVYSSPSLHAKVLATSRTAVIGSANASRHSTLADEAVVVTDNSTLIRSVKDFITSLSGTTRVDATFIRHARAEWAKGKPSDLPGVTGKRPQERALVNDDSRLFLVGIKTLDMNQTDEQILSQEGRHVRRAAGPAARYGLELLQLEGPSIYRKGDALFQVITEDGEDWLYPPFGIFSGKIKIPRTRSVAHILRSQLNLDPMPLPEATRRLKAVGQTQPRFSEDREIRSKSMRRALLDLWSL